MESKFNPVSESNCNFVKLFELTWVPPAEEPDIIKAVPPPETVEKESCSFIVFF